MSKKKSTSKKAAPARGKPASRPVVKKPAKAPAKKPAPKKPVKKAAKPASPAKKPAPVKKAPKTAPKKAAPAKKAAPPVKAVKTAPPPKKPTAPAKAPVAVKPAALVKPAPVKAPPPAPAPPPPAPVVPAPALAPRPAPPPRPEPVIAKKTPSAPAPGPTKTGALFYDSHMHTPLCKHAWGEPEEYAKQAIKAGLKGIIFTCHCPMPGGFWPTVRMAESEFDTYVALVQRAAAAYKGKLHVCLGLESEYFPGYEDYLRELHARADFDYILGGVHWQAGEYRNKFESGTIENFRRIYFDHLAKSAETGLYDCLAHPDLVKNYHPDSWCFAIVKNTAATALDRIAATGVAMELNTSGLNKSYHEMNPGEEMLRMMAERKIPVVIGSDAHKPERVGEHFVNALIQLTNAGYEHVSYFQKRQRIDLKITDVLTSLKKATDHNA